MRPGAGGLYVPPFVLLHPQSLVESFNSPLIIVPSGLGSVTGTAMGQRGPGDWAGEYSR